jgi:hypothetical protein
MLRIMLPVATPTRSASIGVLATPTCSIAPVAGLAIRVAFEIIIIVDGDVVTAPAGAAAPTSAPHRSHRHPDAERKEQATGVIRRVVNRRVRVHGRPVDNCGVVARNVNDLRIGLLDYDNFLIFHHLCFDHHLVIGLYGSLVLRLLAHPLHRVHHI